MSQDKTNHIELSEISDKFTKEVLTEILCKANNGKKVQLMNWSFGDGFTKGDGYMSTINRGTIYGVVDDDPKQNVQVNIVVKSIPKNVGRRKTFRNADFFRNEIAFYTQVVPKFEKFLAERGQSDMLRIPRHLVSYLDGENDFIVLEDVSPLGYGPASRQNCINFAECTTILKTLAKFHSISFAYRDQKKEEFEQIANCVEETYYCASNWDWHEKFYTNHVNIARNALAIEYPNSKADKRFNTYEPRAIYDIVSNLCQKKEAPTSVMSAGDCWAPNFLVRDVGQGQKEALILDFQLARCSSPVCDMSFLIYSCTSKPFRDQYYDDVLKIYHTELSSAIKSLGSDPEKVYPWDLFKKEVKDHFIFGLAFSLEAVPFCLMDPSESFDLDLIKGEEAINIADVWAVDNIKTSSGRQRLADIIVHAVENGYM
ncbi:uncharacterized protein LOC109861064 isoform X2 [Pseudomyrmex gracilis]|nr:uncharacterized protein LOC109861064 isoform X2 [Pseudomyrmex gracilis]XP_020296149.1 uncharacterized protein LOC109861064 isoform X2 [Pseudomyrmex gracilis]XP_020296150.1 uncharacterized protein LOC109861064 isoform X2 [Pseudomyrmex gracilis]XP_020296151.1 uncharacterized protein LOC109861064 isoform X2 [Pseudomyrmex gracilis]XP_020296152.1 uncharacterized protein LOC109861064 isoform X2 [Pseudomyrmex gracilis]